MLDNMIISGKYLLNSDSVLEKMSIFLVRSWMILYVLVSKLIDSTFPKKCEKQLYNSYYFV